MNTIEELIDHRKRFNSMAMALAMAIELTFIQIGSVGGRQLSVPGSAVISDLNFSF